jgi:hypothetical protein
MPNSYLDQIKESVFFQNHPGPNDHNDRTIGINKMGFQIATSLEPTKALPSTYILSNFFQLCPTLYTKII